MALKSSFIVYVDNQPGSFGETMNEIRAWLDHNGIQPALFIIPAHRGAGFEISFSSEGEASLFEHRFAALIQRLPA